LGEISDALRRARDERKERQKARRRVGYPAPDLSWGWCLPALPSDQTGPASRQNTDISRWAWAARRGEWRARAVALDGGSAATECFRHLALKVRAELERRSLRSVAVTGPLRSEGKTTIACNLALALASISRGREVALVDLDLPSLRRPRLPDPRLGGMRGASGKRALSEVCIHIEAGRRRLPAARSLNRYGPWSSPLRVCSTKLERRLRR
jgi:hypothetical protein